MERPTFIASALRSVTEDNSSALALLREPRGLVDRSRQHRRGDRRGHRGPAARSRGDEGVPRRARRRDGAGMSAPKPETASQAAAHGRVLALAVEAGLCRPCASALAWGVQNGFATVHPPCEVCAPLVASWPVARLSGWRTPAGRLTSPSVWQRSRSDRRTPVEREA